MHSQCVFILFPLFPDPSTMNRILVVDTVCVTMRRGHERACRINLQSHHPGNEMWSFEKVQKEPHSCQVVHVCSKPGDSEVPTFNLEIHSDRHRSREHLGIGADGMTDHDWPQYQVEKMRIQISPYRG